MCGACAIVILATDDECSTAEIMRRSGKSKPVVWRWQARIMAEGVEGLARDKTRNPVQSVAGLAPRPPLGEAEPLSRPDAAEGGGEIAVDTHNKWNSCDARHGAAHASRIADGYQ